MASGVVLSLESDDGPMDIPLLGPIWLESESE